MEENEDEDNDDDDDDDDSGCLRGEKSSEECSWGSAQSAVASSNSKMIFMVLSSSQIEFAECTGRHRAALNKKKIIFDRKNSPDRYCL